MTRAIDRVHTSPPPLTLSRYLAFRRAAHAIGVLAYALAWAAMMTMFATAGSWSGVFSLRTADLPHHVHDLHHVQWVAGLVAAGWGGASLADWTRELD